MVKPKRFNSFWEELPKGGPFNMHQTDHRNKVIDLIREYKVKSVLDVGCGSGPNYKILKEKGIEVKYKGTDYSYGFIEICKELFPEVEWEVQDMRNLQEKDNSWEAVVAVHVLDHIRQYKKALREIYRVTSRLAILDIWRPFVSHKTGYISRNEWAGGHWVDTWLRTYNKKELESVLKKIGFKIIYEENFPVDPRDHHSFVYVLQK